MDTPARDREKYSIGQSLVSLAVFVLVFFLSVCFFRAVIELLPSELLDGMGAYKASFFSLLNLSCGLVSILSASLVLKIKQEGRSIGIGWREDWQKAGVHVFVGIAIGTAMITLIIAALYLTGGYLFESLNKNPDLMPYLILFMIGALNEELIFRGYLYSLFERCLTKVKAIVLVSVVFGYAHLINQVPGESLNSQLVACTFLVFEAGLPLTLAFVLTRSIWFAFGIHWAWNFFEGAIYGANVSGLDMKGAMINAELTTGILGGGGNFGPENTLAGLLIGFSFALLLYFRLGDKVK